VTNQWLDELQSQFLMLYVGLINADLNCHRVKHMQHDATSRLCTLLPEHTYRWHKFNSAAD